MQILEAETGFGPVRIFGDKLNPGGDFFVRANCPVEAVKVLLFFDSRGISGGSWEESLLKKLETRYQETGCLTVARPLELTTWATLYNFVRLNALRPELLITNVGIVDYTPKKYSLCQDMLAQVGYSGPGGAEIHELEQWVLSSGETETLFTVDYSEAYAERLRGLFASFPVVSVKTPLVEPGIKIERVRPPCFFRQLHKTNQFIDSLGFRTVELGTFGRELTYDAVHWTPEGNLFAYEQITRNI